METTYISLRLMVGLLNILRISYRARKDLSSPILPAYLPGFRKGPSTAGPGTAGKHPDPASATANRTYIRIVISWMEAFCAACKGLTQFDDYPKGIFGAQYARAIDETYVYDINYPISEYEFKHSKRPDPDDVYILYYYH